MSDTAKFAAKFLALLSKSLTSVSTKLSIAAVLGIATLPLVPQHAASTIGRPEVRPGAPIELVRTKPVASAEVASVAARTIEIAAVPVPPGTAPEGAASAEDATAETGTVVLAARRTRAREDRSQGKREPQRQNSAIAPPEPPKATPVPPPEAKPETAHAEPPKPDVWTEAEVIAALRECIKLLGPIAADIEVSQPVKSEQCGAPAPVMLRRVGSGANRVEINPPAMLNCAMVVSLHAWVEKSLQPAAQETFGSPITRLRNASGYSCRNRNGSLYGADKLSEHARANAIDIAGFVLADGRSIDVVRHWGPTVRDQREAERLAAARAKEDKDAKSAKEANKPEKSEKPERPNTMSAIAIKATERDRRDAEAPAAERTKSTGRRSRDEDDEEAAGPGRLQRSNKLSAIAVKASDRRVGRNKEPEPVKAAQLQKPGRAASDAKSDPKAIPSGPASGPEEARKVTEALFLRRLHKGACSVFGTVLGPEANEAHRDHFHFDLAARRRSAYCQ